MDETRRDIPYFANCTAFTPTGEKVYIGTGSGRRSGALCSFNAKTREYLKIIWPERGHGIVSMAIGPK